MEKIEIVNLLPEHAAALEQLQRDCFPTLSDNELMLEPHFLNHARLFPEGNFVAISGSQVVGLGSGFLIDFDFDQPYHTFQEMIDGGTYNHHDPQGDWYYGADISVRPDFRGRGIGSLLYQFRQDFVIGNNRRGIVAGGLLPGFAEYKDFCSVYDYVKKVVAGEIFDPTLSFQLKNGFEVRGLLENYIEDEAADNWSTLIVWRNPHYTNR